MSATQPPIWLITGSSQGIGLALTRYALSQKHTVIATSRNPGKTPELVRDIEAGGGHWLALDVTGNDVEEVVRVAEALYGRIDVLVNNAAYCVLGSVEEVPLALYREQMETNFYGPVRIMQAVLPGMRARRAGCIINVSSATGIISVAGNGVYASSKFALEAASEALAMEVQSLGIRVAVMVLGAFRTTFGSEGAQVVRPEGDYGGEHVVNKRLAWVGKLGGKAKGDPEKAARMMFEVAVEKEDVRDEDGGRFLRFVLGEDCWNVTDGKLRELRRTWDTQQEYAKRTAVEE